MAVPRYMPAWLPKFETPICSANMEPSTAGGQSLAEKMKKAMSPSLSTSPTKTASPKRKSTQSGSHLRLARYTKRRSMSPAAASTPCAAASTHGAPHDGEHARDVGPAEDVGRQARVPAGGGPATRQAGQGQRGVCSQSERCTLGAAQAAQVVAHRVVRPFEDDLGGRDDRSAQEGEDDCLCHRGIHLAQHKVEQRAQATIAKDCGDRNRQRLGGAKADLDRTKRDGVDADDQCRQEHQAARLVGTQLAGDAAQERPARLAALLEPAEPGWGEDYGGAHGGDSEGQPGRAELDHAPKEPHESDCSCAACAGLALHWTATVASTTTSASATLRLVRRRSKAKASPPSELAGSTASSSEPRMPAALATIRYGERCRPRIDTVSDSRPKMALSCHGIEAKPFSLPQPAELMPSDENA
eukprot:scaffold21750_cov128-Isochrysis_galbana.AAC.7